MTSGICTQRKREGNEKKRKANIIITTLQQQDTDYSWLKKSPLQRLQAATDLAKRYCALKNIKPHRAKGKIRKLTIRQLLRESA